MRFAQLVQTHVNIIDVKVTTDDLSIVYMCKHGDFIRRSMSVGISVFEQAMYDAILRRALVNSCRKLQHL